jgi:hypothetical protein
MRDSVEIRTEAEKFWRQMKRRKIQAPSPDQKIDRCHFSKTGWGIWDCREDGSLWGCTCIPAKRPAGASDDD